MTGTINIDMYRLKALASKKIGVIGLGKMGIGIAVSLIRNRVPLMSCAHTSQKGLTEFLGLGGVILETPGALAKACDVIILSLPSTKEVEDVCFGLNGITSVTHNDLLIIDTTTGHPFQTEKIAKELSKLEIRYVDAPLTRGPPDARRGKLNAILGSPTESLEEACTVLSRFCEYVLHAGGVGEGQKIKLLNNALSMGVVALAVDMIGAAHSLNIEKSHLKLLIERGAVNSPIVQALLSFAIEKGDDPLQFTIGNASKDLNYCFDILEFPQRYPMITATKEVFFSGVLRGQGNRTLGGLLGNCLG